MCRDLQSQTLSISSACLMRKWKISRKLCNNIRSVWPLTPITLEDAYIWRIYLQILVKGNVQPNTLNMQLKSTLSRSMLTSDLARLSNSTPMIKTPQYHTLRKFWGDNQITTRLSHNLEFSTSTGKNSMNQLTASKKRFKQTSNIHLLSFRWVISSLKPEMLSNQSNITCKHSASVKKNYKLWLVLETPITIQEIQMTPSFITKKPWLSMNNFQMFTITLEMHCTSMKQSTKQSNTTR